MQTADLEPPAMPGLGWRGWGWGWGALVGAAAEDLVGAEDLEGPEDWDGLGGAEGWGEGGVAGSPRGVISARIGIGMDVDIAAQAASNRSSALI
jgi:hypothetical protein